jgi:endoglucanase
MRFFQFSLIPIFLFAACVPRRTQVASSSGAPPAPAMPADPAQPVAVHQISEVEPPPVVTPSESVPGFMRGINLGNALDAPSEGAWGVTLLPNHFAMAKAAGLDHVRLPVRFSAHAEQKAPYTIEEALFKRVDWAIDQAAEHGLSIIIDLHHY